MTTAYGDELCGDPTHDPNNGNRWHRWLDQQGRRWASPCPIAAIRDVSQREARISQRHEKSRYNPGEDR